MVEVVDKSYKGGLSMGAWHNHITVALNPIKKEERKYRIGGDIVFRFTPHYERECSQEVLDNLSAIIRAADVRYPWKDKDEYSGKELESIRSLSLATYQYHNFTPPELNVWFRIVPGVEYVRWGQTLAYEKYMETLGETISRQDMQGATSVRSFCYISKMEEFGRTV